MNETLESWVSIQEAHELTGYDKEYLRQLHRSGKLRTKKLRGIHQILFDRKSLEEYIKDKKTQLN